MEDWAPLIGTIFTALMSFAAVYITNKKSNAEMLAKIELNGAVRDAKIEELTREVRKHNGFAERLPIVEGDIKVINEQIKVVNHRIDDLERKESA